MSGVNYNTSPYLQKQQIRYNSVNGQQRPNSNNINGNSNPPQTPQLANKQIASSFTNVELPSMHQENSALQTPTFNELLDSNVKLSNTATNGQDINFANTYSKSCGTVNPISQVHPAGQVRQPPVSYMHQSASQMNPSGQYNHPPNLPVSSRHQLVSQMRPTGPYDQHSTNLPVSNVHQTVSQVHPSGQYIQPPNLPVSSGNQTVQNIYSASTNLRSMQNNFTNMSLRTPPTQNNFAYKTNLNASSQPGVENTIYSGQNTTSYPGRGNVLQSTFANRYPVSKQQNQQPYHSQPSEMYNQSSIVNSGFNQSWNQQHIDLLQTPNILPPTTVEPPKVNLGDENLNRLNCSPEIIRCTLTKIPDNNSLLQKSRLPLGILIHPFKDLSHLPVIQCNVIVRCRSCRTYINPFVYFVDAKRWKCNICYRVNELPEEFQYDPVSKTYGDPSRRPEIKSSTIEYIAPAEYMLRPPQPAIYIFLLDISRLAVESGYLSIFCSLLTEQLQSLPGDTRTQISLLAFDSALHFYLLSEGLSQPQEMIVLDVDDAFLPAPEGLLVNLKDRMEMIVDVLQQLPNKYKDSYDSNSSLGAALQVAHKMISSTGGRITVFQASLPNVGPGALTSREDPNQRSTAEAAHLNPANDFYKRLALECSSQQIAVDLFIMNSQFIDLATVSGISRFSGGCIHHFPLFKSAPLQVIGFRNCLRRYLLRKIGFEAVMRVRCTRGLAVHTFHGNFFVRSTDLLSLPNINPDSAFGLQIAIEENLSDVQTVCFQAALLYTSRKGERRIRVHTLCLPVVSSLNDVIHSADQMAIIGVLAKMAVDRSMQSSLSDAREAFINVAVDILAAYKMSTNSGTCTELLVPDCLKLLPLFISAMLKHPAFRVGTSTRLDDRIKAMIDMKTKPLYLLLQQIYPDLYPIHTLDQTFSAEEKSVVCPPKLHLSARCLENKGAFLMDCGDHMMIWIGAGAPQEVVRMFGVADFSSIPPQMCEIPELEYPPNQRLRQFVAYLNEDKPYAATLQVIRDDKSDRVLFLEKLIEDRLENSMSYHEFLQHLKVQIK